MPNVYVKTEQYRDILTNGFEPNSFTEGALKWALDRAKAQLHLSADAKKGTRR